VADLLADVRRVRQVADVFGPGSTALSMRLVAERALEHDDEEVRRHANQLLAELDRSAVARRRRLTTRAPERRILCALQPQVRGATIA
jgi:hypothetical protein